MIKKYWTRYLAIYPTTLLYMLQDTEYKLGQYIAWFNRTNDFRYVMKRRTLDLTPKIIQLRRTLWAIWIIVEIFLAICVYLAITMQATYWGLIGIAVVALLPFILGYGILVPVAVGQFLIQKPRERKIIRKADNIFAAHASTRIAVVGSYGKTTAKEILATVLAEGLKVAATPGNMNTPIGVSRFAHTLKGDEDVLVLELGEEKPGDIMTLSKLTRPTMGLITGINESHLSSFKTLDKTVSTIFELTDYLSSDATVYKNKESELLASKLKGGDPYAYDRSGVDGWKVSNAITSLEGTTFVARKGDKVVHAHTELIGLYKVGVTVAAISIADSLGLTTKQIETGLSKVKAFDHRMQPKRMHGAWVIDDTYNGNSDGVKDGLALLKSTKAKRRIYVTPGLVEQGSKTKEVHNKIGSLAAKSADMVVLMKNSVTDYIVDGLNEAGFKGELLIVDDPLEFYTNLEHFVAAGDVVLMQNDWTDNYV